MTSASLRRAAVVALALSALAGVPRSAPAQIGGLIKKKIAAAGQDKLAPSTGDNVAFDNITLELTPERLDKIIAGKQAGREIAEGPNGANALREKRDALDEELSQLREKNGKEIQAWETRRYQIRDCRDSVLSVRKEQITREFQMSAMSDPGSMMKMAEISNGIGQAAAKNDTATVRKLTAQVEAMMGPKRADSLAADRKCGSDKDAPPAAAKAASLEAQIDQLRDQIRAAEVAASKAELDKSGMNVKQLAAACERIEAYFNHIAFKQKQTGLTSAELSALKDREKELKGLCT